MFFQRAFILFVCCLLLFCACKKKETISDQEANAPGQESIQVLPLPDAEALEKLGPENDLNARWILPDSLFVLVGQPKKFFASPVGKGNEPFFTGILGQVLRIPFNLAKMERFLVSFAPGIVNVEIDEGGSKVVQPSLFFKRTLVLTFDADVKPEDALGPNLPEGVTLESLKKKIGDIEYFDMTDPNPQGPQRIAIHFYDNRTLIIVEGFEQDVQLLFGTENPKKISGVIDRVKRIDLKSSDLALVASREGLPIPPEVLTELLSAFQELPRDLAAQLASRFRALSISLKMEAETGSPMLDARFDALDEKGADDLVNLIDGRIIWGQTTLASLNEQTKQVLPFSVDFANNALNAMQVNSEGTQVRFLIDKFEGFDTTLSQGIDTQKTMLQQTQMMQARYEQLSMLARIFLVYYQQHKKVPSAILSKDGKPLLSWRVAMLPVMGRQELYDQFKLDEPWDSETNKALLEKMPPIFRPLGVETDPEMQKTKTLIRLFNSEGLPLADPNLKIEELKNLQGTMLLTSVVPAYAVEWTKPEDLVWDIDKIDDYFGKSFFAVSLNGMIDAVTILPGDTEDGKKQREFFDAFVRGQLVQPEQANSDAATTPVAEPATPSDNQSVKPESKQEQIAEPSPTNEVKP